MKTWILFLLVLSTSCARQIVDNELIVGDGSGADVTITADVGNVNNPKIEYDFATGNWRFSNNGVDYDVFGSAASDVLNTNGDLLYFDSGYQRRAIGTEGQLLTVVSGLPTWADAPVSTTLDTKGQLQGYSTVNAAVGPCADGQTLVYDATEATGWKCGIALPDQTGQSGEFLFTNGTSSSWTRVEDRLNQVKNNLLANGSFDSVGISAEYTITTDALVDLTSVTSRTGEIAANNINMLNIEATNGDSSPYDIKAVFTKSQDFEGKQMLAFCEIKTLRPDTFFVVGANGAEQSRREVISDGSWRYYEIPFVGGDTSQYIEVNGETTASQEAISVDNCFMGKVSPDYIRQIDVAMTDWDSYTPTLTNISAGTSPTISFQHRRIGDSLEVHGTIIAGGTGIGITGDVIISIPTGLSIDITKIIGNTDAVIGVSNILNAGVRRYAGNTTYFNTTSVKIVSDVNFTSTNVPATSWFNAAADAISVSFKVPIVGWSVEANTIVTQNTELTAQSANEFVAFVSTTGVVSGENFDWINGNCTKSGTNSSITTCNFKSSIFSEPPNCNAINVQSNAATASAELNSIITASSVSFRTQTTAAAINNNLFINCTRSTDYRKHATIVGKFENINSSELCQVIARDNANNVLTTNNSIPFTTEAKDNCNAWDGTKFTANKNTLVLISGSVNFNAADADSVRGRVNGTDSRGLCSDTSSSAQKNMSCMYYLNAGDYLEMIITGNVTLSSSTLNHEIQITELPDTESIIKNLNDDDSKVVSDTTGNRVKILNGVFSNATGSIIACSSGTCASTGNNTGGAVATFVSTGKYSLAFPVGTWNPLTAVSCSYTCHQTSTHSTTFDSVLFVVSNTDGSFTHSTIGCATVASTPARANSAVSWQCIGEKP